MNVCFAYYIIMYCPVYMYIIILMRVYNFILFAVYKASGLNGPCFFG